MKRDLGLKENTHALEDELKLLLLGDIGISI